MTSRMIRRISHAAPNPNSKTAALARSPRQLRRLGARALTFRLVSNGIAGEIGLIFSKKGF